MKYITNIHQNYEWCMFHELMNYWSDGKLLDDYVIVQNMFNVCIYTHARNLVNNFKDQGVSIPDNIQHIVDMIDDQIVTLSDRRTDETAEKLQPSHARELRNFFHNVNMWSGIES